MKIVHSKQHGGGELDLTDTSFFEGGRDEWIRACRKCYQPIEFVNIMGHERAVVVRYV